MHLLFIYEDFFGLNKFNSMMILYLFLLIGFHLVVELICVEDLAGMLFLVLIQNLYMFFV